MNHLRSAVCVLACLFVSKLAFAHCEVPCGVYGDDRRFAQMMEDHETIAKAIGKINELAGSHDGTGMNQLVRWVTTKEAHATSIQTTISQYFMTQRIKADQANYAERLQTAHAVMVAAMKCKQAADPATADALEASIKAFQKAYTT